MILGVLGFIAAATYFDVDPNSDWFVVSLSGLLVVSIAIFVWRHMQAYVGPAKILNGRPIFAPPLSPADARKNALMKLTYGQLLGGAALGAIMPFTTGSNVDVWQGWGRLYWLAPGILIPLCAVQAHRKWRLTRPV